MVEHDLSWFPSEIKYQYFHCYSCTEAVFKGFIHHLYILLNHTIMLISFQKINCSKSKPWLNMVYHKLLGENVCYNVIIKLKHYLLTFYFLCLMSNKIRYLSLRLAPDNKNYDKYSCDHGWQCTMVNSYSETMVRHHCHNTVNHGQTWLAVKNNGTMVVLTPGKKALKSADKNKIFTLMATFLS